MKKLPSSTIRRLRTDTVVVDVHSAIKELIENALDAGTAAPLLDCGGPACAVILEE